MTSRKERKARTINQDNDCTSHGTNRSKQQSRYNKSAKRNSSRLGRKLDKEEIQDSKDELEY